MNPTKTKPDPTRVEVSTSPIIKKTKRTTTVKQQQQSNSKETEMQVLW